MTAPLILTTPLQGLSVPAEHTLALISGNIDDFQATLVAFSLGGKTIVSSNYTNMPLEDLLQTACTQLDNYSNLLEDQIEVTREVKQACNREVWSKPQP